MTSSRDATVQWTGSAESRDAVALFCRGRAVGNALRDDLLIVPETGGAMVMLSLGDWVTRDSDGRLTVVELQEAAAQ